MRERRGVDGGVLKGADAAFAEFDEGPRLVVDGEAARHLGRVEASRERGRLLRGWDRVAAPAVKRWFARRPRYRVHFTPTGASWLNQVERFFAEITTKRIRGGVLRSVRALERAIGSYIDTRNENAKPFNWTADADIILRRVKNVCMDTADLGH